MKKVPVCFQKSYELLEQGSKSASRLYIPEPAKEKPQAGLVVTVGDAEEIKVKDDDKVLFAKYTEQNSSWMGRNNCRWNAMTFWLVC